MMTKFVKVQKHKNFLKSSKIICHSLSQGDLIIQCEHLYEFLTKLSIIANKQDAIKVVQGR